MERVRTRSLLPSILLLGVLAASGGEASRGDSSGVPGDSRASYSYFRSLEGEVWVTAGGRSPGGADPAERGLPVLTGDRLELASGARAEVHLADRTRLFLGSLARVVVQQVAFSSDAQARSTKLELLHGEIVLRVPEEALGDELPSVFATGARIFVEQPGVYRITASAERGLELVVREGRAELLTDRGSLIVRNGESVRFRPVGRGVPQLFAEGPLSSLERWQQQVESAASSSRARARYVQPELAYAASSLEDYGTWILVDTSWCWRPTVATGWRPYWNGRWHWTPSGYLWISYDPWGWVPDHYGTWIHHPRWGWCWRPGWVFAPAWVYWSWGPTWTGWCPVGLYTYGSPWGSWSGWRFGVYGWTRGSWSYFADWTFVPTRWACSRDWVRHRRHGRDLARSPDGQPFEGVVTTDTRTLPPQVLERPQEVPDLLRRVAERERRPWVDVTDFVARKPELDERLRRAIELPREEWTRASGTPLLRENLPPASDAGWRVRQAGPLRPEGGLRPEGPRSEAPVVSLEGGLPRTGPPARRELSRQVPGLEEPSGRSLEPGSATRQPGRQDRPRPENTPDVVAPDDLQGWRHRNPGLRPRTDAPPQAGLPVSEEAPRTGRRPAGWDSPPQPDGLGQEPIQRVIDGWRKRADEGAPPESAGWTPRSIAPLPPAQPQSDPPREIPSRRWEGFSRPAEPAPGLPVPPSLGVRERAAPPPAPRSAGAGPAPRERAPRLASPEPSAAPARPSEAPRRPQEEPPTAP